MGKSRGWPRVECAKKFVPGSVSYSRDWELKLRRAVSSCAWRKRTTARMEKRKTDDGSKLEMTVCRGWGKSSLATSYPCDATSEASGERSQAARARPKPVIAAGAAAALLQSRKPVLACGARSDVAAGGASRCQLSNWCPRSGASMCSVRPSLRLSVLASLAAEEPRTLYESAFRAACRCAVITPMIVRCHPEWKETVGQ